MMILILNYTEEPVLFDSFWSFLFPDYHAVNNNNNNNNNNMIYTALYTKVLKRFTMEEETRIIKLHNLRNKITFKKICFQR